MHLFKFIAIAAGVTLAGCAETSTGPVSSNLPENATRAEFVAAGAVSTVSPQLIVGNQVTIAFPNAAVTYTSDGQKIFQPTTGDAIQRSWRQREDGTYCEELVGSGEEICGGGNRLFILGDELRQYSAEGEIQFIIQPSGAGVWQAKEPA